MTTKIFQQQTDNGGNICWVLIDSSQKFTDPVVAMAYLKTLSAGHYSVELSDASKSTILAQV